VPTRTFLADNLTADGYELLVAGSLRDALRMLEYHHVDLAIVDVGLPDGSGLDLVRAVRAATGAGARLDARLPLLLVSGRSAEIDRVRGFERGAEGGEERKAPVDARHRLLHHQPGAGGAVLRAQQRRLRTAAVAGDGLASAAL